jgi:hypothetical protein
MKNINKLELIESKDSLYRSIKNYYKTFLRSWLDDVNPDRSELLADFNQEDFINDCIERFGEEGLEEYNSGYSNELVKEVAIKVLNKEK